MTLITEINDKPLPMAIAGNPLNLTLAPKPPKGQGHNSFPPAKVGISWGTLQDPSCPTFGNEIQIENLQTQTFLLVVATNKSVSGAPPFNSFEQHKFPANLQPGALWQLSFYANCTKTSARR